MSSNRSYADFVDVVFDGPPSHESGRFVECENPLGYSVKIGEWIDRGNGLWALRIPLGAIDAMDELTEALEDFPDEMRGPDFLCLWCRSSDGGHTATCRWKRLRAALAAIKEKS